MAPRSRTPHPPDFRQQIVNLTDRGRTPQELSWTKQGKYTEARESLAAIYGWFGEGFATPDLQEAKALLDEPR